MNVVIIKGRLGADVELKSTNTGKHVARLRVAVDRRGKNAGTDWLDVIAWEQKADFAQQYLGKGRAILVEGRLQSRQYQTQDGQKRTAIEIIAENIEFADSKPQGAAQSAPQAQAPQAPAVPQYAPAAPQDAYASAPVADDDIPF